MAQNGTESTSTYLYDPTILSQLESSAFHAEYKDGVKPLNPGENFKLRPLCLEDFDKGYLQLLGQLTSVGEVTKEQFEDRFNKMKACDDSYYVTVIEDTSVNQVIGSATLVKEQKFIHHCSARARVEDVVVSDVYRGKQLGKVLVDVLVALGKKLNCYKISLECKDHNVKFYKIFKFEATHGQNYMQLRFFD
ncbi:glucosamine-6-phosphate n-acetyltransferase [Plakobranchus ocellatus]|uniref:Glucosamine 6-phosphate N-acetyltransferase n=1 Tax=Plakobranchus ocellatus TaxID=259542 RepID=A0AAV3ZFY9_9GAST|nr:glucosamine-6-phosphate n-acetyltransferase [Plakobranchus ocellatus]